MLVHLRSIAWRHTVSIEKKALVFKMPAPKRVEYMQSYGEKLTCLGCCSCSRAGDKGGYGRAGLGSVQTVSLVF